MVRKATSAAQQLRPLRPQKAKLPAKKRKQVPPNDNSNSLAKWDPIELPRIDEDLALRAEAMLYLVTDTSRPPTKKARLLALIVQLNKLQALFPTHQRVAEHIGCTVDNVRAALNDSVKRKLVTQELVFTPGNIAQRESVTRRHKYAPTRKLLSAVNN